MINKGLGAQIIDASFTKETVILGFVELIGGHCAENIQEAIQKILNEYDFDKTIINGLLFLYYSES